MPYITKLKRKELKFTNVPENAGELNYAFTMLIQEYIILGYNYQKLNDIMSILENLKTRTVYVSKKIAEKLEIETIEDLETKMYLKIRQFMLMRNQTNNAQRDILGALEGCKLEFYRRIVVPYEDKKIEENGDVYFRGDENV